jgi:hypothetical protein
MKYFFILMLFMSFSAKSSNSIYFDGSADGEQSFKRALSYLEKRNVDRSSSWIFNNYGLKSGRGNDVLNFIASSIVLIKDNPIITICSSADSKHSIPPCASKMQGNNVTDGFNTYFSGNFTIWSPVEERRRRHDNIGLRLKDGGYIPIDSQSVLIVKSSSIKNISGVANSIYLISEMLGFASISNDVGGDTDYSLCGLGRYSFRCQHQGRGYFSISSLFMIESLKDCNECSISDVIILKYIASKHLLSVVGDRSLSDIGYKLLNKNEDDFLRMGLDVELLKTMYRYILIH